ncbi:MAG: hypothetical protein ABIH69_02995 [bacterium]|nr:hypothetical protein [Candidatus Margulisiibacteriota bacterium]
MKLSEKICDRKIAYLFKKEISLAFEIALLYFVLAKRKKTKAKIAEACLKSIFWLKQAEIKFPEYINKLSSQGQLELLIKILVNNKAKIGARRCLPVLPELCKQFGLL